MYKTIYSCGSSFSCGGGLNWETVINLYKKIHNIDIQSHIEVSYPNIIANKLNLKIVNESIPGGSANRMIRKVYDYVLNNSDVETTLFLLEIPPMWRDEFYSNELNRLFNVTRGVLNSVETDKTDIANGNRPGDMIKIHKNLVNYFKKFIDVNFEITKTMNNLIGLFSFLTIKKIRFIIVNGYDFYSYLCDSNINLEYNFYWYKNHIKPLSDLFIDEDLNIRAELANIIDDNHMGYFGNYKFSEDLLKYIQETIKLHK